ncbi:MAG: DNA mismatch repair protein MutT [Roseovarius sp.]|nr:DNA mismatch repair protein MutT [Roseovarius sp.]MBK46251.1 DNA mismatch repair protein MutT [Roseovarius sp.]
MTLAPERRAGVFHWLYSYILHTVFLMTRGLTLGVRAIVRSNDGRFLLVRHTYTPGWHFPGGGVEKGESAEAALRSELREETGLSLVGRPVLHGVFHNCAVSRCDHVLTYLCDVTGSLPEIPPSHEIAEFGYFDFNALPDDTDPGTVRRMREIVEDVPRGDVW